MAGAIRDSQEEGKSWKKSRGGGRLRDKLIIWRNLTSKEKTGVKLKETRPKGDFPPSLGHVFRQRALTSGERGEHERA